MTKSRDGCVVPTEPLAELVTGFVTDWNRRRPSAAGRFARRAQQRGQVTGEDGTAWLARETGIPRYTIDNVLVRRNLTTELRIADALVTAIGRPEAFHDGTLEVKPNPLAKKAARAACCGDESLNGSLT